MSVNLPVDFSRKLERLSKENHALFENVLKAGAEVLHAEIDRRLVGIGSIDKRHRSTGQLRKALKITKPKRNKDHVWQIFVGFRGSRKEQKTKRQAEIAVYIEHGTSTMTARPFMKPAKEASEQMVFNVMQKVYDEEVAKV